MAKQLSSKQLSIKSEIAGNQDEEGGARHKH